MTTSENVQEQEPRWLQLLRAEANRTSINAAAQRIGYSRAAVSLVLAGKYIGRVDKVAEKAIAALEPPVTVACPHLGEEIPIAQCVQFSQRKVPTHNPQKMAHWRACQECQNRCKGEAK